ncbi:EVE domain-containing protein, partial [Akkermansiaceae bacterium]|nr:EVE domain-containing protein [Akkermansiaceae bacterium]
MKTWIFQGSPDKFDVEGYLSAGLKEIIWSVTRYENQISPGDLVYLWQAAGKRKAVSGILASATVLETPRVQSDDAASESMNVDRPEAAQSAMRVTLRLDRVAKSREIIRRDWLKADPVCSAMLILRQPAGSNFRLTPAEANRISQLWLKTGVTWSRAEAIAALRVYEKTYRQPISKLKGSPVADMALLCGRAIGGAYNKVLNFRAIDPRDERAGLKGAGDGDRAVWREFYDSDRQQIETARLEQAFDELWELGWVKPSVEEQYASLEAETETATSLGLEKLQESIKKRPPRKQPRSATTTTTVFDRDARIVALAKKRAAYRCEVRGCTTPLFKKADGTSYVEVHHIIMLADGGRDEPENVACLC